MDKNYFWQILIALDQLLNTLLNGWADETLSSRAYRKSLTSTFWDNCVRKPIDLVFNLFGKEHCKKSYESEQLRNHLPPSLRG